MTNIQNDLILVGATGKLGSSILKTNTVSYGICSSENLLRGKKIDNLSYPLLGSFLEIPKDKLKNPVVIDASYPENLSNVHEFCLSNKIPLVLASTGHSSEQIKNLKSLSEDVAVLQAPNLSRGIAFFKLKILKTIIDDVNKKLINNSQTNVFIKIIETHHKKKKDSPSGTALDIKKFIEFHLDKDININIESLRDKSSVGRHEVIFGFDNEEILVTHNGLSRDIFGEGARLSHLLPQKKPGLYTIEDLLKEDN
jgi:4-hydroxy-tetrahydrodipicolinate reductase